MAIFPQFGPDPESSLLQQCQFIIRRIAVLLAELDELKAAIERRPPSGHKPLSWNQAVPGLGPFERLIVSERKHLEKMARLYEPDDSGREPDVEDLDGRVRLRLDASNYKFYETVWEVTKRCCELAGMRREVAGKAVVDLVVNGGAEWIKVVTTTERRLLYEMADVGWDWEGEEGDEEMLEILRDESEGGIEVARVARQIVAAARTSYQDYRRPRVRILMSRIEEGRNADVDRLLRLVRQLGGGGIELVVETANGEGLLTERTPNLKEAIANLVERDYFKDFTATLNVDCSVFMALASDFSHVAIGPESELLRSKQHRIDATDEVENGPRLVKTLYPAIVGRDLVCTREAADVFLKIVMEIGTETERARTRVMFGVDEHEKTSEREEEEQPGRRTRELQALSAYPVPDELRLPIKIVESVSWEDARAMVDRGQLPAVALAAGRKGSGLNAMNVSSFLYGWKEGLTTVTSNWEAAKRLRTVIEGNRVTGDEVGPHIWRIPFSRKLLARPKEEGFKGGSRRLKTRGERRVEKEESLMGWVGKEEEAKGTGA
ncbi:hypothetical protein CCHL11_07939 [Colletotrichum chlorophyti]|uniref:DUF1308 domain-containing protein n=1 Tax=Colletotrichum chlorophyti TaxID=708187 RepID=A0A1Q8S8F0_9PEZI|nr:hypothetical protein CCHL11_07939 [Colletotrichum chlorophyti]